VAGAAGLHLSRDGAVLAAQGPAAAAHPVPALLVPWRALGRPGARQGCGDLADRPVPADGDESVNPLCEKLRDLGGSGGFS